MNPVLMAGTIIVNFALISYTIFIYHEHKHKASTPKTVFFLTAGVILDVIATVCMIKGSSNTPFTLHGFVGYSSLAGMLTDAVLIWKHKTKFGDNMPFPNWLNVYSKIAYTWWVMAYITGAILVIISRSSN